jgi:hypothetical protein
MKDKITIISFDAVKMYPSIRYKFVKKAVKFYARNLYTETQGRIDTCLEMIKFGMGNTLLTFVDKYYEYGGDLDIEDRGLTIGGYESAWLADLCMAYVMDNSRDILDDLIYEGIYRDDGIAVLKGSVTTGEVAKWLGIFQARVNHLADSKFLEFTAEIWGNDKDDGKKYKAVGTTNKNYFTFLDMEMHWSPEGHLQFRVHLKENQVLKYLNRRSTHTDTCFAAIPTGVMKRLASLTTRTEESELTRMDELYPAHAQALKKANLAPDTFPTLGEILDNQQMDPAVSNAKERKNNQDTRTVRFCLGMRKWWNNPVHAILKELRNKHELTWLRVTMSYHKFSNLREIFQGDLNRKLMDGIISRDFIDRPCNCNCASKIDGKCAYNGECRKMCVVYKATCKICNQSYIGQTQQKLKDCMGQHFS